MVRGSVVSGQFYEAGFQELDKQIAGCFESKLGPGDLPVKRSSQKIRAVIVPHAGYTYSGPCAAWAYKEIAESVFPDVFVILAPNHNSPESGLSLEDWKTPFGVIRTDKDFVIGLKENSSLKINESAHAMEHSLEVQLPFLQFVNKDMLGMLRIVPITVGQDIDYATVARELKAYVKKSGKEVVYIVSSDFTHYGRNYGYVPFTTDITERLLKLNKGAIDHIKSIDVKGFADYLNKTQITICGYMPILVLLSIFSGETVLASLLMHYTSTEITGDEKSSVSYVSMLFR